MIGSQKILALVTDAYGGRGGIAQYNRDVLGAFAGAEGVALVAVLPRHAPDQEVPPHVNIRQAKARAGRLEYSLASFREAAVHKPGIVFCGHLYMAPLAALIARISGAKLIVQTHGIEVWGRPNPVQRAAAEAADIILAVSRHTRAMVLSWAAVPPERVVVLPNTVREVFSPGDASDQRSALGLSNKRVLLTVARMDARRRDKGHDLVIATIPDLVKAGHDVIYVIAGEGDDRPRLEALARQHGAAGRVVFLGAPGVDELVHAYRMADVFVMPSIGEGFGIAFLEAAASGTRAIGLAVGGASDALADGRVGTAVSQEQFPAALARLLELPKGDPQTLAAAVRRTFGRELFGSRARAVVRRLQEAVE